MKSAQLLLATLALVSAFLPTPAAWARSSNCSKRLTTPLQMPAWTAKRAREVQAYFDEVRVDSRLSNILLRDATREEQKYLWGGLLSVDPERELTRFEKAHRLLGTLLNPFQPLTRWATQKRLGRSYHWSLLRFLSLEIPAQKLTLKRMGKAKQPRLLISLALNLTVFSALYSAGDAYYLNALHANQNEIIARDYRYGDIHADILAGHIDEAKGRERFEKRREEYREYYDLMNSEKGPPSDAVLLQFSFFDEVKTLAEYGVHPTSSIEVPEDRERDLSDAEIHQLIRIKDTLFFEYQLIPPIVAGDQAKLEAEKQDPVKAGYITNILNDPYSQALFELRKNGEIDSEELTYRLMEDAFWKTRFMMYEALGVTPHVVRDGKVTAEKKTIETIREISLKEIAESH